MVVHVPIVYNIYVSIIKTYIILNSLKSLKCPFLILDLKQRLRDYETIFLFNYNLKLLLFYVLAFY